MSYSSRQSHKVDDVSTNISVPQQDRRRQSILLLSESVASRRSSYTRNGRDARWRKSGTFARTPPNLEHGMDSRGLIDRGSPNFKSLKQQHQEEILNSVRTNYLNDYMSRKTSGTSLSSKAHNDSSDSDEGPELPERDPNLESQGGHITRDLYRLTSPNAAGKNLKKTRSADDLSLLDDSTRPGSTASALNIPGGFRRDYILQKHKKRRESAAGCSAESRTYSSDYDSNELGIDDHEEVPFLTRNFLEFLYVYGHFAGESFEDEFYTEESTSDEGIDERSPLLARTQAETGKRIYVPKSAKGTTSTMKAFLLMIKSFIGTGVLFLPGAFSNGGLVFSLVMLIFFGAYSFWCYYILTQSKVATRVASFGDIGLTLYGPWMKFIILLSLVMTQLGFSGAYVVFTAKNLLAFVNNVFYWPGVTIVHLLALQLVIFIPLSFIRNIAKLSLSSLVANFLVMGGIVIVIGFTAKHLFFDLNFKPAEDIVMGFNSSRWTLYVGTAIFAFEGIGLIIPIQGSMKHPEKFPLVLALVIISATVLFVTVGTLGYLSYGAKTETVILLNLPQGNILVNLIQFFYSSAILLSTPLQLFPAIAIIENKVFPKFTKIYVKRSDHTKVHYKPNSGKLDWRVKWLKNFVRSLIVSLVVIAAYFGADHLDTFVSIVGSFACIPLVYIYPPMLHLESCSRPACQNETSIWKKWPMAVDYVLIIFGAIGMVYTSYQSIFG